MADEGVGEDKDWGVYEDPMEIMPLNDLMSHTRGMNCSCKPYMYDTIIVHNSFDCREEKEL